MSSQNSWLTIRTVAVLGVVVLVAPALAQHSPVRSKSSDAPVAQQSPAGELTDEEAAILADAWERIQMLRERQQSESKREADREKANQVSRKSHSITKSDSAEDLDRAHAKPLDRSIDEVMGQQAEQLGESIEAWADKFGADAEQWAEQFGQDMEQWADQFSGDWEQWADEHGAAWEQWAEKYGQKWEQWGEQFEDAKVNGEQLQGIIQQNLEMLKQMPIDDLSEQISKSSEQLKELPWERLREMEDLVRESIRDSLEGAEKSSNQSGKSPEQSARIRMLHDSLKQLHTGLDAKRAELDAAAAKMMSKLDQDKMKEAKANAEKAYAEAKRQLFTDEIDVQKLYERAAKDRERALGEAEKARLRALSKKLDQEHERLDQQERTLRKEIAQRVAIDHHGQNLAELRAEIDALRAEIDALRARATEKADRK